MCVWVCDNGYMNREIQWVEGLYGVLDVGLWIG